MASWVLDRISPQSVKGFLEVYQDTFLHLSVQLRGEYRSENLRSLALPHEQLQPLGYVRQFHKRVRARTGR